MVLTAASRRTLQLLRAAPVARLQLRSLATPASSSQVVSVKPSENERLAGRMESRTLEKALQALHLDGLVMLENVVPHDALDRLNKRMVDDARTLFARGEDSPYNYNRGNIQQAPPYDPAVFDSSIFMNPLAIQLTNAFLGERPTLSFISGNTAVKATEGQPVHTDSDFAHPDIPFAAVVNVGLVEMRPDNGSTEVWLGTHTGSNLHVQEGMHGERASGRIKMDLLEERRKVSPPLQPFVPKGSLLVRDLRLWHAGMPNTTDEERVMLALIHFAPWYRQRMTLKLPRSLRTVLDNHPRLAVAAEWTDEPVDHLSGAFGNAFDFNQDV